MGHQLKEYPLVNNLVSGLITSCASKNIWMNWQSLAFFYRNKACITQNCREQIVQSIKNYGEVIYMPASTLKPLCAIYHFALRFITGDSFRAHRCILYETVGWQLFAVRTALHFIFSTKHLLVNFLGISHVFLTIDHFHTALGPRTIWSSKIILQVLRLANCLFNTILHTSGTICGNLWIHFNLF